MSIGNKDRGQENNSLAVETFTTCSSLDENNYKEIVYMNKDDVLEELCGYLGQKKDKSTRKISWDSEHPAAIGRQQKCDTISGRISCLAPNSRANNIENIEDTFH